jgi:hypothetical protein
LNHIAAFDISKTGAPKLARRDAAMQQTIPIRARGSDAQQPEMTPMPGLRCHAFALGIVFATVLLVYSSAFHYESINPDFVTMYTANSQRTIGEVLLTRTLEAKE